MKKEKRFRKVGWRIVLCVAALVLAMVVNWAARYLPASSHGDLTAQKMFTLSDTTRELLSGLESDVRLLFCSSKGTEDVRTLEILQRYADASGHVSLSYITPTEAAYYTSSSLDINSVIVAGEEYACVLTSSDIYQSQYITSGYYKTLADYRFAAENELNQAIANVTKDLPVVWALQNHGETAVPSGISELFFENGCHMRNLYLSERDSIPENCEMVLINQPQGDLTSVERKLLSAYLDDGGSIMLISAAEYPLGENFERLTEKMGLSTAQGIIIENNMNYMYASDYPYYLLTPAIEGELTQNILAVGAPALMSMVSPLYIEETAGVVCTPLLTTSSDAFLKPNALQNGKLEYEDGDEMGPFTVAVAAESEQGGKLFWLGSSQFLIDEVNSMIIGANYALVQDMVSWMQTTYVEMPSEIPSASLMQESMQGTSSQKVSFIACAFALPAVLMIVGIVVKKKNS